MTQALLVGGIALAGIFAFTQFGKKEPETEDAAIDQQVKVIIADIDKEIADLNEDLDKAVEQGDDALVVAIVTKVGDLEADKVDVVVAGADAKATVVDPVEVKPDPRIKANRITKSKDDYRDRKAAIIEDLDDMFGRGQYGGFNMPSWVDGWQTNQLWLDSLDEQIVAAEVRGERIANAEVTANAEAEQASRDNWQEYFNTTSAALALEFPNGGYGFRFPPWQMGWDADSGWWKDTFNENYRIAWDAGKDHQRRLDDRETQRLEDKAYADDRGLYDDAVARVKAQPWGAYFTPPPHLLGNWSGYMAQQERVARSKYDQKVFQDQEDERQQFELQQAKNALERENELRQERENRQAVQDAIIEQADRDNYEDAKQNLYREFPEERGLINRYMSGYRSNWRQFQGQLRSQLTSARHDKQQNDINQFNNTKTRITNQYPDGAEVVRVWAYDEDWRDIEADVRADAREAHRARADFKAQIAQAAADRAAAEQESGEDAAIDWRYADWEDEGGFYTDPWPTVATPVPVRRPAPPVVQESHWQKVTREAYEAAELRAAYATDWDEF